MSIKNSQQPPLAASVITKLKGDLKISDITYKQEQQTIQKKVKAVIKTAPINQDFSTRALGSQWPQSQQLKHDQQMFDQNQVCDISNFQIEVDPLNRLDNLKNCIQDIIKENHHDFLFGKEDSEDKPIIDVDKLENVPTLQTAEVELTFQQSLPQNILTTNDVKKFVENTDFKVLKDGQNMSELELFTVAFDEILILLQSDQLEKLQVPQIITTLTKIKNYFVNKATKQSTAYMANEAANRILDKQLQQSLKDIQELNKKISSMQADSEKLRSENTRLQKQNNALNQVVYNMEAKRDQMQNLISSTSAQLEKMQKQIVDMQESRDEMLARAKRLALVVQRQNGQIQEQLEKLKGKDKKLSDLDEEKLSFKSKLDNKDIEILQLKQIIEDKTKQFEKELSGKRPEYDFENSLALQALQDLSELINNQHYSKEIQQQLQNVSYILSTVANLDNYAKVQEFFQQDSSKEIFDTFIQRSEIGIQVWQTELVVKKKKIQMVQDEEDDLISLRPKNEYDEDEKARMMAELLNEVDESNRAQFEQFQSDNAKIKNGIKIQKAIEKVESTVDIDLLLYQQEGHAESLQSALMQKSQTSFVESQLSEKTKGEIRVNGKKMDLKQVFEADETLEPKEVPKQQKKLEAKATDTEAEIEEETAMNETAQVEGVQNFVQKQQQHIKTSQQEPANVEIFVQQTRQKHANNNDPKTFLLSASVVVKTDYVDATQFSQLLHESRNVLEYKQLDEEFEQQINFVAGQLKSLEKQQVKDSIRVTFHRNGHLNQKQVLQMLRTAIDNSKTSQKASAKFIEQLAEYEQTQKQDTSLAEKQTTIPLPNLNPEFLLSLLQNIPENKRMDYLQALVTISGDERFVNQMVALNQNFDTVKQENSKISDISLVPKDLVEQFKQQMSTPAVQVVRQQLEVMQMTQQQNSGQEYALPELQSNKQQQFSRELNNEDRIQLLQRKLQMATQSQKSLKQIQLAEDGSNLVEFEQFQEEIVKLRLEAQSYEQEIASLQAYKQSMLLAQSGNNSLLCQQVQSLTEEVFQLKKQLHIEEEKVLSLTLNQQRLQHKYENYEKRDIFNNLEMQQEQNSNFLSLDKFVQTIKDETNDKEIQSDNTVDQFLASSEIAKQMQEMAKLQFEEPAEVMQEQLQRLDDFQLNSLPEQQVKTNDCDTNLSQQQPKINKFGQDTNRSKTPKPIGQKLLELQNKNGIVKKANITGVIYTNNQENIGKQYIKDTFQLGITTRVAQDLSKAVQLVVDNDDDLSKTMQKVASDQQKQDVVQGQTKLADIQLKVDKSSYQRNQEIKNQFLNPNFQIGVKLNLISEKLQQNLKEAQKKIPEFEQFANVITIGNQKLSVANQLYHQHLIQHPRYGSFIRQMIPVSEPVVECFQVLHAIDKNFLRFYPVEKHIYAPMAIGNVNLVHEIGENSKLMQLTHQLYLLRIQQIQTHQQIPERLTVKHLSLIPNIAEQIKYIRCSAINYNSFVGIPSIFQLLEQNSNQKLIVREFQRQKYFEIPFNNIVVKSLRWLIRLIRQIVRDRMNTTVQMLVVEGQQSHFITEMVQDTGSLFFNVIPGDIQRREAESLAAFTLLWTQKKYGRAALANVLIYSLIANLIFWQYESEEVYLFARMLFGDLGTDYQLLYLDLRKMLGFHESSPDYVEAEKIAIELVPDILRSLFKNWNSKRHHGFLQNLYAVLYSQQYEHQNEVPQVIDFTLLANLCLYSFAAYRRTGFQQMKLAFNYLTKELGTETFINIQGYRQLCAIVLPQLSNSQVNEFWFMFGVGDSFEKKVMGHIQFQDFFESFGLGRYGQLQTEIIEKVTSLQLKQLMKNTLFVFESLKPTLTHIVEHIHVHIQVHGNNKLIKIEKQILALVELIKSDIMAYDYPNCVNDMKQLAAVIVDMFLHLNPAGAIVVLGGAFTATQNFLLMLK